MQKDTSTPFAFIHVPKCAGTSLRSVFFDWYGAGVIPHYYHEPTGGAPKPITLDYAIKHLKEHGSCCIFGHFNCLRGFGVRHNISFVEMFFTILREPFSQFVSEFKYKAARSRTQLNFESYLQECSPNYLNHFPNIVSFENYKEEIEKFEFIGIYEYFEESVEFMSRLLGKEAPGKMLKRQNVGPSDSFDYSKYRLEFEELNSLECEAYNYARKIFEEKVL
ncbi:sulfotransferase family 2 domain-containing protein [Aliiglaciecola lipolytica]|uniref:Sulfotransferase family protein n=1 Tax=Aliiglaciecola lipolytica E3 TaxID=1127673 RepID=K6Y550_9ALTE|nr:sulfotransferase family 2 domain-containing protein [Aliiglaciecola lipolytica]GAC13362.1 hypothetical protein GLIP_0716 [Aliiglaciecola lipolytica E3]